MDIQTFRRLSFLAGKAGFGEYRKWRHKYIVPKYSGSWCDMAPYWVVLENGIWKNAPRTDTESAPWSTPTRFFLKAADLNTTITVIQVFIRHAKPQIQILPVFMDMESLFNMLFYRIQQAVSYRYN